MYRNQLIAPYPLADDFVPYNLRHTYCTDLQKKGIDIRTAQYLMGHSDISLTANIYTHADNSTILEAAKIINSPKSVVGNVLPNSTKTWYEFTATVNSQKVINAWKCWKFNVFKRYAYGADEGTWTPDLRVTNALLYHLSYISIPIYIILCFYPIST